MEEQILRYYLSLFSIFIVIFYFLYLFLFKSLNINNSIIEISKGESIYKIADTLTKNEYWLEKKIYDSILIFYNEYYNSINYGKFEIKKNINFIELIQILSKKSNLDYKITIVEGWEKYQLNGYLSKFYKDSTNVPYNNLIADTYIINSSNNFDDFKNFLLIHKKNFFNNYKDSFLIKKYGVNNIMIIASLVEKEAKNNTDKALISSVILNRLDAKMKLQIDATVISSITEGKYKFSRPLIYSDLKIKHPLNTYINNGIPPKMISYAGVDTIEIILENFKSDFLFYFYNVIEKKHIFSKQYTEHKKKLNDYRKKIK